MLIYPTRKDESINDHLNNAGTREDHATMRTYIGCHAHSSVSVCASVSVCLRAGVCVSACLRVCVRACVSTVH